MKWSSSDVLDEIFGIGPEHPRTVAGWLAIVHPDDREMMSSHFDGAVQFHSEFDRGVPDCSDRRTASSAGCTAAADSSWMSADARP